MAVVRLAKMTHVLESEVPRCVGGITPGLYKVTNPLKPTGLDKPMRGHPRGTFEAAEKVEHAKRRSICQPFNREVPHKVGLDEIYNACQPSLIHCTVALRAEPSAETGLENPSVDVA
jgi:hypothetical protein